MYDGTINGLSVLLDSYIDFQKNGISMNEEASHVHTGYKEGLP